MSEFPEHDKLVGVVNQTQAVADFVLWLENQGYRPLIYKYDPERGFDTTVGKGLSDLLAEWQGVDLSKLEAEKNTILARMRQLNGKSENSH